MRTSIALALALLCAAVVAAPPVVNLTFDAITPLRTDLRDDYVSANIDTASVGKGLDFSDVNLNNLVRQLGPILLRLGGTASNSLVITGSAGSLPCGSGKGAGLKVADTCIDQIASFLNYTGAKLLFDFQATRAPDGSLEVSNASHFMTYIAAKGYGPIFSGFASQIGNENPGITNGTQMGTDFLTLQSIAQAAGISDTIIGPSAGGTPAEWEDAYMNATYGKLAMYSVHTYGGVNCNDATGQSFVSRSTYKGFLDQLHGLTTKKTKFMAPSTRLLIEETASAPNGGCKNMSSRFIDGFYWVTIMGMPGQHGVDQINRQDICGWSFPGEVSQYMLAGPPGWINATTDGPLMPHPSWFTTVLWKQLMGTTVLNSTVAKSANASAVSETTFYAWCTSHRASTGAVTPGSVTVAYVVGYNSSVVLSLPGIPMAPREEFILTASASEYSSTDAPHVDSLPPTLFDDAIYNNGALMTVDKDGILPAFPIPGRVVATAGPDLVLPPFSYGFVTFSGANVRVCGGTG